MSQVASIYRRDKGHCWICGRGVAPADASRDHVKPRSKGGYDKAKNYRLAHRSCNTFRGSLDEATVRAALATVTGRITPERVAEVLGPIRSREAVASPDARRTTR